MKNPLVSIIICNYNYGLFIQNAIDSALNQDYPNIEVIIVDDGSTDNSREVIASYGERVISIFKENGGQSSAFNTGFSISSGEIICFLDSDDEFAVNKVTKVVKAFEDYETAGWLFHTHEKLYTKTGQSIRVSAPTKTLELMDLRFKINSLGEKPPFAPATSATCFQRSLLKCILPMPDQIKITSDNYFKFAAVSEKPGLYLNQNLSSMKIHTNNLYTDRKDYMLAATIDMVTAFYLRANFSQLKRFSNRLFRTGLANYWRCNEFNNDCNNTIKNYLKGSNPLEELEILSIALLHRFNIIKRVKKLLISSTAS